MVSAFLDYCPFWSHLVLTTVSNPLHITSANMVTVAFLWRTQISFTGVVMENKKKCQKHLCSGHIRHYTNSEQKDMMK